MSEQVLKVITFNLKRDSRFARKKIWENRRELAAGVIRDSGASVVGVNLVALVGSVVVRRR